MEYKIKNITKRTNILFEDNRKKTVKNLSCCLLIEKLKIDNN